MVIFFGDVVWKLWKLQFCEQFHVCTLLFWHIAEIQFWGEFDCKAELSVTIYLRYLHLWSNNVALPKQMCIALHASVLLFPRLKLRSFIAELLYWFENLIRASG